MSNIINYGRVITDEVAFIDELEFSEFLDVLSKIDLKNKTIYKLEKQKD